MSTSKTSRIGAIGELRVTQDLLQAGFDVFSEVTGSAEIDLVAIKGDQILRVQVKTQQESNNDVAVFSLRRGGVTPYQRGSFDMIALYVVDRNVILYALDEDLEDVKTGMSVRFSDPKNGQKKDVRYADDFTIKRISR